MVPGTRHYLQIFLDIRALGLRHYRRRLRAINLGYLGRLRREISPPVLLLLLQFFPPSKWPNKEDYLSGLRRSRSFATCVWRNIAVLEYLHGREVF
jgi:hypothetical protein